MEKRKLNRIELCSVFVKSGKKHRFFDRCFSTIVIARRRGNYDTRVVVREVVPPSTPRESPGRGCSLIPRVDLRIFSPLSRATQRAKERERDACETELKETRRNRTKHSETETDTCRCKILVLTYTWDYVHTRVHPLTRKCVWTRAYTRPRLA